MSHAAPIVARKPVQHQDDRMSAGAYLLQGTAFLGFLIFLFVLAGFRG
jgi:hypothetical protein